MYLPMGSSTSTVSRKKVTIINLVQSRTQIRVSIDFSCPISKIQNTGHSQRISPWEVIPVSQKNVMVINFSQSRARGRVLIGSSCNISKIQNTGHS
ncbi:hypothetical protein B296_00040352 [Ensete ventricosum]|uniref:Uncharacterized protein n=1 Tax=Ensete ventricosum TaxID=4639 RepID=A0A426ZKV1_ENSVE|nr:hypothetical protein B296_00040352 [Ensete ventricosum]